MRAALQPPGCPGAAASSEHRWRCAVPRPVGRGGGPLLCSPCRSGPPPPGVSAGRPGLARPGVSGSRRATTSGFLHIPRQGIFQDLSSDGLRDKELRQLQHDRIDVDTSYQALADFQEMFCRYKRCYMLEYLHEIPAR